MTTPDYNAAGEQQQHHVKLSPWHVMGTDSDHSGSCSSGTDFIDNGCYSSQEAVSEDYHPFPNKLPPHAANMAAQYALLEDERALAEPPRGPRSLFIDDIAEVAPECFDADNASARMKWPASKKPSSKKRVDKPGPAPKTKKPSSKKPSSKKRVDKLGPAPKSNSKITDFFTCQKNKV